MRKNNVITVDGNKLNEEQRFPFDNLGLEYQEGELEQV